MVVFIERNASILEPRLWQENFAVGVQRPEVDPPMESEMVVFIERNASILEPRLWEKKFAVGVQRPKVDPLMES